MLFINFLCVFYLMVFCEGHTISKNIEDVYDVYDILDSVSNVVDYRPFSRHKHEKVHHQQQRRLQAEKPDLITRKQVDKVEVPRIEPPPVTSKHASVSNQTTFAVGAQQEKAKSESKLSQLWHRFHKKAKNSGYEKAFIRRQEEVTTKGFPYEQSVPHAQLENVDIFTELPRHYKEQNSNTERLRDDFTKYVIDYYDDTENRANERNLYNDHLQHKKRHFKKSKHHSHRKKRGFLSRTKMFTLDDDALNMTLSDDLYTDDDKFNLAVIKNATEKLSSPHAGKKPNAAKVNTITPNAVTPNPQLYNNSNTYRNYTTKYTCSVKVLYQPDDLNITKDTLTNLNPDYITRLELPTDNSITTYLSTKGTDNIKTNLTTEGISEDVTKSAMKGAVKASIKDKSKILNRGTTKSTPRSLTEATTETFSTQNKGPSLLGTDEMEVLIDEIKRKAFELIIKHNPTITGVIANAVTEATFVTDPILKHTRSIQNVTNDSFETHQIKSREVKGAAKPCPCSLEDKLQRRLNHMYKCIKHRLKTDYNTEMTHIRTTMKKETCKIMEKIHCCSKPPCTKPPCTKPTTTKVKAEKLKHSNLKVITTMTPSMSDFLNTKFNLLSLRRFRNSNMKSQTSDVASTLEDRIATKLGSTAEDDYVMLNLYEELLGKQRDMNMNNMLNTMYNLKQLRSSVNTDKADVKREVTNDDQAMPTYSTTNIDDISNKISYKQFVDGYKHYLNYQKDELKEDNFSNLIKYQAHKHHNVDDIGKYILRKLPQLPYIAGRLKRSENDSVTISWLKKHFHFSLNTDDSKKHHTSEIVTLKLPLKSPEPSTQNQETRFKESTPSFDDKPNVTADASSSRLTDEDLDKDLEELGKMLQTDEPVKTTQKVIAENSTDNNLDVQEKDSSKLKALSHNIINKLFYKSSYCSCDKKSNANKRDKISNTDKYVRLRRTMAYEGDDESFTHKGKRNDEELARGIGNNFDRRHRGRRARMEVTTQFVPLNIEYLGLETTPQDLAYSETAITIQEPTMTSTNNVILAHVHLREPPKKKHKVFKEIFNGIALKRTEKPKRHISETTLKKFGPFKKLRNWWTSKPKLYQVENTMRNYASDVDILTQRVEAYKPVKYNGILSLDDLLREIPNITDDGNKAHVEDYSFNDNDSNKIYYSEYDTNMLDNHYALDNKMDTNTKNTKSEKDVQKFASTHNALMSKGGTDAQCVPRQLDAQKLTNIYLQDTQNLPEIPSYENELEDQNFPDSINSPETQSEPDTHADTDSHSDPDSQSQPDTNNEPDAHSVSYTHTATDAHSVTNAHNMPDMHSVPESRKEIDDESDKYMQDSHSIPESTNAPEPLEAREPSTIVQEYSKITELYSESSRPSESQAALVTHSGSKNKEILMIEEDTDKLNLPDANILPYGHSFSPITPHNPSYIHTTDATSNPYIEEEFTLSSPNKLMAQESRPNMQPSTISSHSLIINNSQGEGLFARDESDLSPLFTTPGAATNKQSNKKLEQMPADNAYNKYDYNTNARLSSLKYDKTASSIFAKEKNLLKIIEEIERKNGLKSVSTKKHKKLYLTPKVSFLENFERNFSNAFLEEGMENIHSKNKLAKLNEKLAMDRNLKAQDEKTIFWSLTSPTLNNIRNNYKLFTKSDAASAVKAHFVQTPSDNATSHLKSSDSKNKDATTLSFSPYITKLPNTLHAAANKPGKSGKNFTSITSSEIPDYFNELLIWHSDILHGDKFNKEKWRDLVNNIDSEEFTLTPNLSSMQKEVSDMNNYIWKSYINDTNNEVNNNTTVKYFPGIQTTYQVHSLQNITDILENSKRLQTINNIDMETKEPTPTINAQRAPDKFFIEREKERIEFKTNNYKSIDAHHDMVKIKDDKLAYRNIHNYFETSDELSNSGESPPHKYKKKYFKTVSSTPSLYTKLLMDTSLLAYDDDVEYMTERDPLTKIKVKNNVNPIAFTEGIVISKPRTHPVQYFSTPLPMKSIDFANFLKSHYMEVATVNSPELEGKYVETWPHEDNAKVQGAPGKQTTKSIRPMKNKVESVKSRLNYDLNSLAATLAFDMGNRRATENSFSHKKRYRQNEYKKFYHPRKKMDAVLTKYRPFSMTPDGDGKELDLDNTYVQDDSVDITFITLDNNKLGQLEDNTTTTPDEINLSLTLPDQLNSQKFADNMTYLRPSMYHKRNYSRSKNEATQNISKELVSLDEVVAFNGKTANNIDENLEQGHGSDIKRVYQEGQLNMNSLSSESYGDEDGATLRSDSIKIRSAVNSTTEATFTMVIDADRNRQSYSETIEMVRQVMTVVNIVEAIENITRPNVVIHIDLPVYYAPESESIDTRHVDKVDSFNNLPANGASSIYSMLMVFLNKFGLLRNNTLISNLTDGLEKARFNSDEVFRETRNAKDALKAASVRVPNRRVARKGKSTTSWKQPHKQGVFIYDLKHLNYTPKNKKPQHFNNGFTPKFILRDYGLKLKDDEDNDFGDYLKDPVGDSSINSSLSSDVLKQKPISGVRAYSSHTNRGHDEQRKRDTESNKDSRETVDVGSHRNTFLNGINKSNVHVMYKRDDNTSKRFTAKDVAGIEVIVDLVKHPINDDNIAGIKRESIETTHRTTNALEVHIAIPENSIQEKGDSQCVRKVFSAKLSTPVDLEFQIDSFENNAITQNPDYSEVDFSPGLYLLLKDSTMHSSNRLNLKPMRIGDVVYRSAPVRTKNVSASAVSFVSKNAKNYNTNTSESRGANDISIDDINKQLARLYENLTAVARAVNERHIKPRNAAKYEKQSLLKHIANYFTSKCKNNTKHRERRQLDFLRKFLGHDRVCNCRCKPHQAMCRVCAASDTVISEVIFEFNNLAKYMKEHCTEIQTYFWINPSGGRKLKESVHKIDKMLTDYYKRAKGKCEGQTCESLSCMQQYNTRFDKKKRKDQEYTPTDLTSNVKYLQKRLKYLIRHERCLNTDLLNTVHNFLNTLSVCSHYTLGRNIQIINENKNKRRVARDKNVKNVYSLEKFNVNIISYSTEGPISPIDEADTAVFNYNHHSDPTTFTYGTTTDGIHDYYYDTDDEKSDCSRSILNILKRIWPIKTPKHAHTHNKQLYPDSDSVTNKNDNLFNNKNTDFVISQNYKKKRQVKEESRNQIDELTEKEESKYLNDLRTATIYSKPLHANTYNITDFASSTPSYKSRINNLTDSGVNYSYISPKICKALKKLNCSDKNVKINIKNAEIIEVFNYTHVTDSLAHPTTSKIFGAKCNHKCGKKWKGTCGKKCNHACCQKYKIDTTPKPIIMENFTKTTGTKTKKKNLRTETMKVINNHIKWVPDGGNMSSTGTVVCNKTNQYVCIYSNGKDSIMKINGKIYKLVDANERDIKKLKSLCKSKKPYKQLNLGVIDGHIKNNENKENYHNNESVEDIKNNEDIKKNRNNEGIINNDNNKGIKSNEKNEDIKSNEKNEDIKNNDNDEYIKNKENNEENITTDYPNVPSNKSIYFDAKTNTFHPYANKSALITNIYPNDTQELQSIFDKSIKTFKTTNPRVNPKLNDGIGKMKFHDIFKITKDSENQDVRNEFSTTSATMYTYNTAKDVNHLAQSLKELLDAININDDDGVFETSRISDMLNIKKSYETSTIQNVVKGGPQLSTADEYSYNVYKFLNPKYSQTITSTNKPVPVIPEYNPNKFVENYTTIDPLAIKSSQNGKIGNGKNYSKTESMQNATTVPWTTKFKQNYTKVSGNKKFTHNNTTFTEPTKSYLSKHRTKSRKRTTTIKPKNDTTTTTTTYHRHTFKGFQKGHTGTRNNHKTTYYRTKPKLLYDHLHNKKLYQNLLNNKGSDKHLSRNISKILPVNYLPQYKEYKRTFNEPNGIYNNMYFTSSRNGSHGSFGSSKATNYPNIIIIDSIDKLSELQEPVENVLPYSNEKNESKDIAHKPSATKAEDGNKTYNPKKYQKLLLSVLQFENKFISNKIKELYDDLNEGQDPNKNDTRNEQSETRTADPSNSTMRSVTLKLGKREGSTVYALKRETNNKTSHKKKCGKKYYQLMKSHSTEELTHNAAKPTRPMVLDVPPLTTTTTTAEPTVADILEADDREVCDPAKSTFGCMCDLQATYEYVLENYRRMKRDEFDTFVRNIHCHKYKRIPKSFILDEVAHNKICRRHQGTYKYKEKNINSNSKFDNNAEEVQEKRSEDRSKKQTDGRSKKQSDSRSKKQSDGSSNKQSDGRSKKQSDGRSKKQAKFDWIRRKRSLLSVDQFETYERGRYGIYEKRTQQRRASDFRRKRATDLGFLVDGLKNLPAFDNDKDEVYVMKGDIVTLECRPYTLCPRPEHGIKDLEGEFMWSTDRDEMLKYDNVAIEGEALTIRDAVVKNNGVYNCSKGGVIVRKLFISVVTVPKFHLVFLPMYSTGSDCRYEDLTTIATDLGPEMTGIACTCERLCSVRMDEPVCVKDMDRGVAQMRAIGVLTSTHHINVRCSAQCRRDLHCSMTFLSVTNIPPLLDIGLVINNQGNNRSAPPAISSEGVKWVVTNALKRKDSNQHHEFHRLAAHMDSGDIDIVVACPSGFYLLPKYKICVPCPMNTYALEGSNSCTSCPPGTRAPHPGSCSCRPILSRHRRYDWAGVTWGYRVAVCCMLCVCGVGLVGGVCSQCRTRGSVKDSCAASPRYRGSRSKWRQSQLDCTGLTPQPRPISPSKVILPRFFKSAPSSRATDSQETKFSLWKGKNSAPPLPPIDFD